MSGITEALDNPVPLPRRGKRRRQRGDDPAATPPLDGALDTAAFLLGTDDDVEDEVGVAEPAVVTEPAAVAEPAAMADPALVSESAAVAEPAAVPDQVAVAAAVEPDDLTGPLPEQAPAPVHAPVRRGPGGHGTGRPSAVAPHIATHIATPNIATPNIAVPHRTAPRSAVPHRTGAQLWPWQEPFERPAELEPWEEIPVVEPLADRAATALRASSRIVVASVGDGIGRTTVTAGLGLALAGARTEPVIAVDACAEGALATRVGIRPTGTADDLVDARADLGSIGEVRWLIGGDASTADGLEAGLDVLPGGTAGTEVLRAALTDLAHWYTVVLVDAPAGTSDPAFTTVIEDADVVVLVTLAAPADLNEARLAVAGLGARPVEDAGLPPRAVIVAVVSPRRGRWSPRTRAAAASLERDAFALVRVPHDSSLAGPGPVGGRLRRRTRKAFLRLGASVVEASAAVQADEAFPDQLTPGTTARTALAAHAVSTSADVADPRPVPDTPGTAVRRELG